MKTKHTPTPWHIGGDGNEIRDVHEDNIVTVGWTSDCDLDQANAELIVRAVNSHETLLEMAKRAQNILFAYKHELAESGCDVVLAVEEDIRKAIAQAEAQP